MDIRLILCGDGFYHLIAAIDVGMHEPLITIKHSKFQCVFIALIIHIHNRRAVARDGLLNKQLIIINRIQCESCIALCHRIGLFSGDADLVFGFYIRILIIIGVFLPMNDGIVDLYGFPYSLQGKLSIQRLVPVKCFIIIARSPVLEFITRAGRVARLDRAGRITGLNKERLLIAAASAIKLDPVAGFDLGIEGDIACIQRY